MLGKKFSSSVSTTHTYSVDNNFSRGGQMWPNYECRTHLSLTCTTLSDEGFFRSFLTRFDDAKKNDSSLILGHPTELQTFSLCDTMKCQMTANLHGRTIENPRPCFVPKRDAKANNAFHTCVRMSKKW